MAASTLAVLSSAAFPHVFDQALAADIRHVERAVKITEAQRHLVTCWYEDHADCIALATVHPLGSDYDYCLLHFQALTHD